jgi:hypothetical protein
MAIIALSMEAIGSGATTEKTTPRVVADATQRGGTRPEDDEEDGSLLARL